MMNVRDLNVKEIENYISFVDLFNLFLYLEITIVIIISREPPLKINNSKTWKLTTLKIAKFHLFGTFENQGGY
jgi:hypothetical protein